MRAIWNKHIIAESDKTEVVENNHYFPPESVNQQFLEDSDRDTLCPWKGKASYFNLVDKDEKAPEAAWYYPDPKKAAKEIKNYIAFDKNQVSIETD